MFTTLRSKIIAGFSVLVAVHLVFTLWSVNEFARQSERSQALSADLAFHTTLLLQLSGVLADEYRALFRAGSSAADDRLISSAKFERLLEQGRSRVPTDTLFSLRETYDSIGADYRRFVTLTESAEPIKSVQLDSLYSYLYAAIGEGADRIRRDVFLYRSTLRDSNQQMLLTVSLVSLIAAILGVLAGVVYSRWALQSIERLRSAVLSVRRGELVKKVHITSADELGDLSFEFNRMLDELRRYREMNLEAVLLERRRSDAVITSVDAPIVAIDGRGAMVLANDPARRLFGLTSDVEVKGEPLESIVADPTLVEWIESLHDATAGESASFSWSVEREGIPVYFSVAAHRLRSVDGLADEDGFVLVFSDVSEFRKLDTLRSDLLARVSHELRTPVSSIVMAVDLLRTARVGEVSAQQVETLDDIMNDLRRLRKMINELLETARAENLEVPDDLVAIELVPEIDEVIDELRSEAEGSGVEIVKSVDAVRYRILPEHLHLILRNLVSNAIRYSPTAGRVEISASGRAGEVILSVSDTGIGIPPIEQEKIFERFYQIDRGTGSPPGSVGLGLAMVREIVERYGGTISVASRPEEKTIFSVVLPPNKGGK